MDGGTIGFLLLMMGSTAIDFFVARAIARSEDVSIRHFNFFIDSFAHS